MPSWRCLEGTTTSILVSLLTVVTVSTVPVMASSTLADSLLALVVLVGIRMTRSPALSGRTGMLEEGS